MSHYTPPLHRRILPWLFFLIFLAVAPVLLLYTAGYRYNAKKNQLERNGTLIVDSTPSGATIFIDGHTTHETSPVTFLNMAPGWHRLELKKPGFHPWKKTMEVRAEQVSFANDIWLWREHTPSLVLEGDFRSSTPNPLQDMLALIEQSSSSSAKLWYWSPTQTPPILQQIPSSTVDRLSPLRWNARGTALLGGGITMEQETWWSKPVEHARIDLLPRAIYHWLDQSAIGARTQTFTQTPLVPPTLSTSNHLSLKTEATSSGRLLVERSIRTHAFALPPGNWNFGDLRSPYVLLNDGDHWLAVHPRSDQPHQGEIRGDRPRWFDGARQPTALFLSPREVWVWTIGNAPLLLWRQSEPLVQAVWHRSGQYIFLADKTRLSAISLNDHYGRIVTTLAEFDDIVDMGLVGRDLYIAATKNNQRGLWRMQVE